MTCVVVVVIIVAIYIVAVVGSHGKKRIKQHHTTHLHIEHV